MVKLYRHSSILLWDFDGTDRDAGVSGRGFGINIEQANSSSVKHTNRKIEAQDDYDKQVSTEGLYYWKKKCQWDLYKVRIIA